jgi:hypothetical protein
MAIDYNCLMDTPMSVAECMKILMREIGFKPEAQKPSAWLMDENLATADVRTIEPSSFPSQMCEEHCGFQPRLRIRMRPYLSGRYAVQGSHTILRTVDAMLRNTQGDLAFWLELERLHLLRRDGKVVVRDDIEEHWNRENIERFITVPYEFKVLRP